MPHSDGQGKDVALTWFEKIRPATVVDVGAGAGTYVKLMRQPSAVGLATDVPPPAERAHDRVFVIENDVQVGWNDRWTAIEGWAPYVDEFGLKDLYDEVIVSDARHLNWLNFAADLVIAGDVLEHMERDDARRLIKRIKQGAQNLIVSIPVLHLPQGAVNGNPLERHVDHWTAASMGAELGDGVVDSWVGDVLAYFWWQRADMEA
jgi:2-polyprenyl-3-methyl-5-hydroxy-6-metoxy-1,4-benzoquinol methylase